MAGRLPLAWGTSAADLALPLPADTLLDGPTVAITRAVPVAAPPATTWRWVCQLAVAPYSYDWIDNRGRRSPRELTPGADALRVGQRMVMVYDLTEVDPGEQWSGVTHPAASRLFGRIAVTYAVVPDGAGSRLLCRMVVPAARRVERLRAHALAWGDLVMMRRQLLTLGALAERDARR